MNEKDKADVTGKKDLSSFSVEKRKKVGGMGPGNKMRVKVEKEDRNRNRQCVCAATRSDGREAVVD